MALQRSSRADRFHSMCVLPPVRCVANLLHRSYGNLKLTAADMQGFCFCWMLEHTTTIQHRGDRGGQVVRHRYRSYFTKLHHQNIIMCRARPEVNSPEVFRGHDGAWFCNYRKMLLVLWLQLCGSAALLNAAGGCWWMTEQTCSRAILEHTQPVESPVRHALVLLLSKRSVVLQSALSMTAKEIA